MGGDNADLELLEGVKEDDEMELGDEAADVSIVQSFFGWYLFTHATRLPLSSPNCPAMFPSFYATFSPGRGLLPRSNPRRT